MITRVNRLINSAASRINRLAHSGKKTAQRIISGTRKAKSAGSDRKNTPPPLPETEPAVSVPRQGDSSEQRSRKPSRKKKPSWTLDDFVVDPLPGKTRFHDFDIDLRLMHGIAAQGYQYCTPIQEKALPDALLAKDIIGRAQTGTGKTAVFMLSLFCRLLGDEKKLPPAGHPRALIIAPTRELVIQIVKDGKNLGAFSPLKIVAIYGGTDYQKQKEMLRRGRCDVIAATPGRLLDFMRQNLISLDRCTSLVIDEADRMLDMGFIPDVRRILSQMPDRGKRQTMLFSATVTDDVRRLALQWCSDPVYHEVGEDTIDVSSIEQRIYLTTEQEKFTLLYNLVTGAPDARILVFENMKSDASRLANRLKDQGISCQVLTGDVPQEKRQSRLEGFRSGKNRLLIATDVAGRGIHVDDIEYVVNYTLPHEPESYVHRIGRTGRAGAKGVAVSFACEQGSFNIPAIEDFINAPLNCMVPEDALLVPVPPPIGRTRPAHPGRRRPQGKSRNHSSGRRRGKKPA